MLENAVLLPATLLILGAIISSIFKGKLGNYISSFFSFISSLIMCYLSLNVLFYGNVLEEKIVLIPITNKLLLPINLNVIFFKIDPLSAFFTLILGVVGLASSVYGLNYINRYLGKLNLGFYGFNYSLFICFMYLTFIVHDFFWFIVFWELMTVTSQFLISYEKEKVAARKAAYKYFCMVKAGSEAIIVSALILILLSGMQTSFTSLEAHLRSFLIENPALANAIIALLFIGFSVKASLVPFHTWLPDAHPEAPSNVSALLSGVMVKTAIYMLFRLFYFFSEPTIYWGYIVATLGTITLIVGTMYAILQSDSKRLLAYSSVGQLGYIVLALGSSMVLYSMGSKEEYAILASIAFAAALYHTFNHALFKSLLFLTAGSVVYRTGLRDLNVLGGLARFMPLTYISTLIASLSIAGVPPLNGFVSKWLIYSSTIPSFTILTIYGVLALFMSAVTAAYFIKYFTTLFAKPPTIKIKDLKEVPPFMTMSQIFLAIICIVFGIYPLIPLNLISSVSNTIFPLGNILLYLQVFPSMVLLKIGEISTYSPLVIAVALTLISAITVILLPHKPGKFSVWSCGMYFKRSLMNMPATSYFKPFEESFKEIYSTGRVLHKIFVKDFIRKYFSSVKMLAKLFENFVFMLILVALIANLLMIIYFLR